MRTPAIPANEDDRLAAPADLLILDSPPEERFDAITKYCVSRFDVPISLVSLVDRDRRWFKSSCGLDAAETARDVSFCGHAILSDAPLVVVDALKDERFFDNPLVVGPPNIRFHAGFQLVLDNGPIVGSRCLIDSRPRHLAAEELARLADLAKTVARELQAGHPDRILLTGRIVASAGARVDA